MSAGRVLCGRYAVGEIVGRGGVADVRVGRDIGSDNWVAIKALRKELADDPLFRSSLWREAQTMGRLRHHSIVALHGTGHDAGCDAGLDEVDGGADDARGVPFIVMEYVAGWSVRDLLRMGELTLEKSIPYQLGVLSALEGQPSSRHRPSRHQGGERDGHV